MHLKGAAALENNNITKAENFTSFKDSPGKWIFRVVKGALIGTGAILPGVSGGALCAAFGIYRPMMDFFAHPTKNFKNNVRFFLPFLIGTGLGFVGLAKLVALLMGNENTVGPVMAFFIGCIIATIPSLHKEGDGKNWKSGHWIALAVSTAVTVAGLLALDYASTHVGLNLVPPSGFSTVSFITWLISGTVFALGAIVPGMSPSSLLMYVGLYEPMTKGLGDLDMAIVIPFIIGALLCIVLFSKLISWMFEKSCRTMFSIVIGIVLGSTLLLPTKMPAETFHSGASIFIVIGCFAAGVLAVWLLSFLDKAKEAAQSGSESDSKTNDGKAEA